MAQFVDFVVDRRIFFNIGVGRGNIRLGLIIIVIADKILNRILGKKLFKLRV